MSAFWIAIIIGFLALDTTIAFQVLVSQPIFSCSLLGWLLGDLLLGVEIGIMMQLLWINLVPIGGTQLPEANVASMVICTIAVLFKNPVCPNLTFCIALMIGLVISYIGGRLTFMYRRLNGYILELILKATENASFKEIVLLDFMSMLIYFLMITFLVFLTIVSSVWVIPPLQENLPGFVEQILVFVKPAVWGIGVALTLQMIYQIFLEKYEDFSAFWGDLWKKRL